MTRGTLHLVVGPSGAGKDAVIERLRAARPDLFIPPRAITRAAGSGGEAHEGLSLAEFAAREAEGGFALCWDAHGLRYGVPRSLDAALAAGRHALVNVSRAVIDDARRRYAPLVILRIDAPAEVRARRLAGRGREGAADVAARLARADALPVEGPDVRPVDNGGALDDAAAQALAALAPAP